MSMKKIKNLHRGSSLDAFLAEAGITEEVDTIAVKRVIAWQGRIKQKITRILRNTSED